MAQITPNMQLTVWNQKSDLYDSSQLAKNFILLDNHDHSSGKGRPIDGASGIKTGSITGTQLATNIITSGHIQSNTIDASKIVDGSIGQSELASNSVTSAKIVDANVTSAKLDPAIVTQLSIDTDASKKKRYKYIATEQTVTSTSHAWATTPDRIDNLVVATPGNSGFGIINFVYFGQWRNSSVSNSSAAARLYLIRTSVNPNVEAQAYALDPNGGSSYTAPVRTALTTNSAGGNDYWRPLHTIAGGFTLGNNSTGPGTGEISVGTIGGTADVGIGINGLWGNGTLNYTAPGVSWLNTPASDWDANQIPFVAPPAISMLVPAGTYSIGIKFNQGSTGGAVTIKKRHIWAWTESFAVET